MKAQIGERARSRNQCDLVRLVSLGVTPRGNYDLEYFLKIFACLSKPKAHLSEPSWHVHMTQRGGAGEF
jgi:hypothetical protein